MNRVKLRKSRLKLSPEDYKRLRQQVVERDNWRCQNCGSMRNLEVHHNVLRSHMGGDEEYNLITLCSSCHKSMHS